MKIEIKKYPIPWRFSNSKMFEEYKGTPKDRLFTHYIKVDGFEPMPYSKEYIDEHGEQNTIDGFKRHINIMAGAGKVINTESHTDYGQSVIFPDAVLDALKENLTEMFNSGKLKSEDIFPDLFKGE